MEPAAPGTEDIVLPSVILKKEQEDERLLSIVSKLPNGKYGNVFEHSVVNGSDYWYCNLCVCPVMGRVYHHESGKRHIANMHAVGGTSSEPQASNVDPETEAPILVAPGEPNPPGIGDNTQNVAQIQGRLDGFTSDALVGLEYVLEFIEYPTDKEPHYMCALCFKRGDPRTLISHLASFNHISLYLQRHFLKCYQALAPYMIKQYKRNWQIAMQKVAAAIEAKFGRLKPTVVEKSVFDKNRHAFISTITDGPHFTERPGLTFEELITKEELTKVVENDDSAIKQAGETIKGLATTADSNAKHSPSPPVVAKPKKPRTVAVAASEKQKSLSSVSSISSDNDSDDLSYVDAGQLIRKKNRHNIEHKQQSPILNKNRSPFKSGRYGKRIEDEYVRHRNRFGDRYEKSREILPWQRSDYRSRDENPIPDRPKSKIDKQCEFMKLANAIEKDMEHTLLQHEKQPEKHPEYNEEWKKFWNLRYKQLQAEGKNPADHDFKPEWIEFWNKRLKELHANEVKKKKGALRKRLGLPDEPSPVSFKIAGKKEYKGKNDTRESKLPPMASTPDQDPDVIIIDDKDAPKTSFEKSRSSLKRSCSPSEWSHSSSKRSHSPSKRSRSRSKRSRSPWESESGRAHHRSRKSQSYRYGKSRSRSRSRRYSRSSSRSRSRGHSHRSRSRERKIEWASHNPYRDYPHEHIREPMYYRSEYPFEYIKPPRVMRDVTRHPVKSPPLTLHHIPPEPEPEPEDDGEINIVSVLRLLTAVEEKLGSLGPKVIDLLSQALAMEKSEPNSSETLLDNDINCVMFETVKEKLKGQLLAGLVSYAQDKAFKTAIKKIASLMYFASERKREKAAEKQKLRPIEVPGIGTIDKSAISKQIAAALIAQGKTDVTQSELEQLINAVIGMAEASQGSNKPMTTATFLQQLTQQKQPTSSQQVESLTIAPRTAALSSKKSMEGLTDGDMQTLLQNFKDLSPEEQHSLISYLKKLEAREPKRVESLRQYVKLDGSSGVNEKDAESFEYKEKSNVKEILTIHSDEEDYTFEDVLKAADKNIRDLEEKEEQKRLLAKSTLVSQDAPSAQSLIANILGQFKNMTEMPTISNSSNPVVVPPTQTQTSLFPASFSNSNFLNNIPINVTNIASALNAVQQTGPNSRPVAIQPPISNPNMFSLQPSLHSNNPNFKSNNFPVKPQQNAVQTLRQPLSSPHQELYGSNLHFEPALARQKQIRPLLGNNSNHGGFNNQSRPNRFGSRPEYFEDFNNRW